jgi:hypothetical protein
MGSHWEGLGWELDCLTARGDIPLIFTLHHYIGIAYPAWADRNSSVFRAVAFARQPEPELVQVQ